MCHNKNEIFLNKIGMPSAFPYIEIMKVKAFSTALYFAFRFFVVLIILKMRLAVPNIGFVFIQKSLRILLWCTVLYDLQKILSKKFKYLCPCKSSICKMVIKRKIILVYQNRLFKHQVMNGEMI